MFVALKIATIIVVAMAMVPALAHALELPGKMRLSKEEYRAVQCIYYPGFTIAGVAEPVSVGLTLLLVIWTPAATPSFWLTLAAFLALAAMHATYWLLTHPVNNFWLKGFELSGLGARFFSIGSDRRPGQPHELDWTVLRDRWERSHLLRAALSVLGLILLVTAAVI